MLFQRRTWYKDPITGRTHYEVPDPGMFPMNYERQGLRSGTFLSFYSVLVIFSFVGLTVVAFIYANHWWQVLIAFFIGNFVSNVYSKNLPLRLHSARYYLTQVLTPLVIIASYIILINY